MGSCNVVQWCKKSEISTSSTTFDSASRPSILFNDVHPERNLESMAVTPARVKGPTSSSVSAVQPDKNPEGNRPSSDSNCFFSKGS
mmetsp:Transcript_66196/g.76842  ORF Transcript_66196/g.76842 Transcript_66196/m.76842 type:complete len:86 (+) Transcript_66196:789-1046(+)